MISIKGRSSGGKTFVGYKSVDVSVTSNYYKKLHPSMVKSSVEGLSVELWNEAHTIRPLDINVISEVKRSFFEHMDNPAVRDDQDAGLPIAYYFRGDKNITPLEEGKMMFAREYSAGLEGSDTIKRLLARMGHDNLMLTDDLPYYKDLLPVTEGDIDQHLSDPSLPVSHVFILAGILIGHQPWNI